MGHASLLRQEQVSDNWGAYISTPGYGSQGKLIPNCRRRPTGRRHIYGCLLPRAGGEGSHPVKGKGRYACPGDYSERRKFTRSCFCASLSWLNLSITALASEACHRLLPALLWARMATSRSLVRPSW